jgi:GT2 family glycosyltransferase
MTTPAFSVVIGTLHRPEQAVAAVRSVLDGGFTDVEVLIVDQSRDDHTRKAVTGIGDARVVYIHSDVMGLSRARNLGASRARAPLLAFLDDDAVAEPGWLAAFADAFAEDSRTGMVGGKLLPRWEAACPAWFPPAHAHLLGLYDIGDTRCDFPGRDLPMGGNFAIASDVLRRLNGFDMRLGFDDTRPSRPVAGEDSALAEGVRAAGMRLIYEPRATARHLVPAGKLRRVYYLRRMYWAGRSVAQLRWIRPTAPGLASAGSSPPKGNRALSTRGLEPSVMRALGSLAAALGMVTELCARAATGQGARKRAS